MDISAFSDDNFDAAEWINKTYKNSENSQSKDVFVSSKLRKLQLYVQQVNSALEDTSQQVIQNMPRIMKEATVLAAETETLRKTMNGVQNEIAKVQRETSALGKLERLDDLKSKLQNAKQALQETDGWGKLTSELDDLLERNDINLSSEKLLALQKSLAAQQGLPGQLEREIQVEDFKNRLEAIASPFVVQCFTSGDVEQSKKYVTIFNTMDRLSQLKQYYRTVQKNLLQQNWIEITDAAENSGSNRFLRDFYDLLIEFFHKQQKWCQQVFDTNSEPILLISELLVSLQPNRESVILSALKRTSDKLETIKELSDANLYLGSSFIRILSTQQHSNDSIAALCESIYNYFHIFIKQYSNMEQSWLSTNLNELTLNENTAAETIRNLEISNAKVIQWIDKSMQRCSDITQNCAIASMINVLQQFLKKYLENFKKAQLKLQASRSINEDWSLLQLCINLLQRLGELQVYVVSIEKRLTASIVEKNSQTIQNCGNFEYKIIGKRDENEFAKLVTLIKEKEISTFTPNDEGNYKNYLLEQVFEVIKKICIEIHDTTLSTAFSPAENYFKNIDLSESVGNSSTIGASSSADDVELPDYSFAPQEYITQIGQYLLTLPQHLEPLLLSPSEPLKIALKLSDDKYSRNTPSADILLSLISEECCALYQENINRVSSLSGSASKQLAIDIEYLGSVLEELGLTLNTHLNQTAQLLRAPNEKYLQLSSGCDPRLVTFIRQIRNIPSTV
uniref:Conserved oligomeric Golgi complex subunit 7 n=1 Tax=Corethrella appendiculata TaxID=1370023 RepID=U5EWI3_9DIPT